LRDYVVVSDDESSTSSSSSSSSSVGISLFTAAFVLLFLTGNCDMCSGSDRDYLGDAIDAMNEE